MYKTKRSKILALLLTLCLVLIPMAVSAGGGPEVEFNDVETDHWAFEAVESTFMLGISKGYDDGGFHPGADVTRAEFCSFVNRTFGFTKTAGAANFTDVPAEAWYANDIKIASAMGYMKGVTETEAAPGANIKRQEAFTILARVYYLTGTEETASFSDWNQVAEYAKAPLAAMAKAGYIKGNDGKINPTNTLSRAETVQSLYNLYGSIIDNDSEGLEPEGNITVRTAVTLKDMNVGGNVFISAGAGDAEITLENVKIDGALIIAGGKVTLTDVGAARIDIHNDVEVALSENASIKVADGILTVTGEWAELSYDDEYAPITLTLDGNKYIVDCVPKVELPEDTTITKMVLSNGIIVDGKGKVGELEIVVPTMKPDLNCAAIAEGIVGTDKITGPEDARIKIGDTTYKFTKDGLTAVEDEEENPATFTLSFDLGEFGVAADYPDIVKDEDFSIGSALADIEDPEDDSSVFMGWFIVGEDDEEIEVNAETATMVGEKTVLKANWAKP